MKVATFNLRIGGGKSFYARGEDGRQITVVDAFCVLDAGELPVCVGMCCLEVKMQFDRAEAGSKHVRVTFANEDDKIVLPAFESAIDVKIPDNAATATVPFALMLKQLSLPAFGEYSINLAVDGRLAASTPLYVRQKAYSPPPLARKLP
jgi:hypothetical protein